MGVRVVGVGAQAVGVRVVGVLGGLLSGGIPCVLLAPGVVPGLHQDTVVFPGG